ncbi:MAG: hypothetical protein ACXAAQ_16135 [Candidatus Thorarchaeota archaeon]
MTVDQRLERIASIIIILTTLLAPFGVYFFSLNGSVITVSIHSLLWGIMPGNSSFESLLRDSYLIIGRGLFYGIFNIWFGIAVIRYFKDNSRRTMVLMSALLSIIFPFFLAVLSLPWLSYSTTQVYLGPIPIQLITGLILMRIGRQSESIQPWSDEEKD